MPIVVPQTDCPELSVVMVLFGGGKLAIGAVASLVEHTPLPFEVIVVDNCSPDGSAAAFEAEVAGATLLKQTENLGFGPANNLGASHSHGRILCFLNPDARVTAGWVEPLIEFARRPNVGAVAPGLMDEEGVLHEAGAVVDHWGLTAPPRGRDFAEPLAEPAGPCLVDYASAACLVMRADVFQMIRGFDPAYKLAYYEDVDLAFRLWDVGLQVWCVPLSRVVHLGGASSNRETAMDLWHRNRSVFLARWHHELVARPALSDPTTDLGQLAIWREPGVHLAFVASSVPQASASAKRSSMARPRRFGVRLKRLLRRVAAERRDEPT